VDKLTTSEMERVSYLEELMGTYQEPHELPRTALKVLTTEKSSVASTISTSQKLGSSSDIRRLGESGEVEPESRCELTGLLSDKNQGSPESFHSWD